MNSKKLNVTVLGCGAVGLFYGYHLHKAGAHVSFLARSNYDDLRHNALEVHFGNGIIEKAQVRAVQSPDDISETDVLLVCTKTVAREYLLQMLPKLVKPDTFVLTLQNGLGNEQFLLKHVTKEKILGGVVFVCLERVKPYVVSHMGFGMIKASSFLEENISGQVMLKTIQSYFSKSGIKMDVLDSVQKVKWEKLIWNVPFNGLSASLQGVDTQAILKCKETKQLVQHLMEEVLQVSSAAGVPLSRDLIDQNIKKTEAMGAYRTSMCVDFLKQKPLEIESILGEPVREASKYGCKVPFMESLYAHLIFYNKQLQGESHGH